MVKGHVTFRIASAYLEFPSVDFAYPGASNVKVIMEAPRVQNADNAAIQLRVELEGASKDEAIAKATAVATSVTDRLVYGLGSYLPAPTLQDTAFDVNGLKSLGDSMNFFCRGVQVNSLGKESLGKLLATASRADFPGEIHITTLRAALGCDDPIGRFLCLYGILMTLAGDDQKKIDTLIKKHEPGQALTARPDKPNVLESSYTRLRNEVALRLKTKTIGAIRTEMEQRLSGLTAIVR